MAIRFGDADDVLRIDVLPLRFLGCASGYDADGNNVYSVIFGPPGLDPETLSPDEEVQVMLSRAEARDLLAAIREVMRAPDRHWPRDSWN